MNCTRAPARLRQKGQRKSEYSTTLTGAFVGPLAGTFSRSIVTTGAAPNSRRALSEKFCPSSRGSPSFSWSRFACACQSFTSGSEEGLASVGTTAGTGVTPGAGGGGKGGRGGGGGGGPSPAAAPRAGRA